MRALPKYVCKKHTVQLPLLLIKMKKKKATQTLEQSRMERNNNRGYDAKPKASLWLGRGNRDFIFASAYTAQLSQQTAPTAFRGCSSSHSPPQLHKAATRVGVTGLPVTLLQAQCLSSPFLSILYARTFDRHQTQEPERSSFDLTQTLLTRSCKTS